MKLAIADHQSKLIYDNHERVNKTIYALTGGLTKLSAMHQVAEKAAIKDESYPADRVAKNTCIKCNHQLLFSSFKALVYTRSDRVLTREQYVNIILHIY